MSDFAEAAPPAAPLTPSTDARAARLEKFKREQLIVDYLNRGVSVAEIAARVGVGEKRMRAVIREILARRMPAPPEEFLAIQVSRLNEALLVAYGAMADRNLKAVDRVVRIVRELDRYHGFLAVQQRRPEASRLAAPAEATAAFGGALVCRAELAPQTHEKIGFAPGIAIAREGKAEEEACPPRERDDPLTPIADFGRGDDVPCRSKAPDARVRGQDAPGGRNRPENPMHEPEKIESAPGPDLAPEAPPSRDAAHDRVCGFAPSEPMRDVHSVDPPPDYGPEPARGEAGTPRAAGDAASRPRRPADARVREQDTDDHRDRPENPPQALEITESAPGNPEPAQPAFPRPSGLWRPTVRMLPNGVAAC